MGICKMIWRRFYNPREVLKPSGGFKTYESPIDLHTRTATYLGICAYFLCINKNITFYNFTVSDVLQGTRIRAARRVAKTKASEVDEDEE